MIWTGAQGCNFFFILWFDRLACLLFTLYLVGNAPSNVSCHLCLLNYLFIGIVLHNCVLRTVRSSVMQQFHCEMIDWEVTLTKYKPGFCHIMVCYWVWLVDQITKRFIQ